MNGHDAVLFQRYQQVDRYYKDGGGPQRTSHLRFVMAP